jgi:hypothetical protein
LGKGAGGLGKDVQEGAGREGRGAGGLERGADGGRDMQEGCEARGRGVRFGRAICMSMRLMLTRWRFRRWPPRLLC